RTRALRRNRRQPQPPPTRARASRSPASRAAGVLRRMFLQTLTHKQAPQPPNGSEESYLKGPSRCPDGPFLFPFQLGPGPVSDEKSYKIRLCAAVWMPADPTALISVNLLLFKPQRTGETLCVSKKLVRLAFTV